jgi:hypothetical protein
LVSLKLNPQQVSRFRLILILLIQFRALVQIHLSQICALIPAINKLVSGFFLPQNEHSNTTLAILF